MTLTIEIPENVVRRAELEGRPVAELIEEAVYTLDREPNEFEIRRGPPTPGFRWLGTPTMSPEEAGVRIRELASKSTLEGLKIKDLIEEDRRY